MAENIRYYTYSLPYLESWKSGCHRSFSLRISISTLTISTQFSWRYTLEFLFILFLMPGVLQANLTRCVKRSVRLLPKCLMTWKQGLSFLMTLQGGFLSTVTSLPVSKEYIISVIVCTNQMYRVCTCVVWGRDWSDSVVWNESLPLLSWTSSCDEGGWRDGLVEEESTLPE